MSESELQPSTRVKIFLMRSSDEWADYSVGFFLLAQEAKGVYLRVVNDPTFKLERHIELGPSEVIIRDQHLNNTGAQWDLNLRLDPDTRYDIQGENVLTWYEHSAELDIGISFKDTQTLRDIHTQIQKHLGHRQNHFRFDQVEANQIIMPSLQNLDKFHTQIQEHPNIIVQNFTQRLFDQLAKLFHEAEQAQNDHVLEALYLVFRGLIYLRDSQILMLLMQETNFQVTFGVLECICFHQEKVVDHSDNRSKVSYRRFLNEQCNFKLVFADLDPSLISTININYRLTYLKESVMAYILFQEDPTYLAINSVILENNYVIVKSLLNNHKPQLVKYLGGMQENILEVAQFINEFYMVFARVPPPHFEFKQQLQDLNRDCRLIYLLNTCMSLVLKSETYDIGQKQFICSTLLTFQGLFMNFKPRVLVDFLLENNSNSSLFWSVIHDLMFGEVFATHPMVVETIQILFQQSVANVVRPQFILFLHRAQPLLSTNSQALALYEQLVRNYIPQQLNLNDEFLRICSNILNEMRNERVAQRITALKFFKYLVKQDEKSINDFLILYRYPDIFTQFKINRRQEGIFEGILRETVLIINGLSSQTIKKYIYAKLSEEERESTLFKGLTAPTSALVDPINFQPPQSPQHKQNFLDLFDEEKMEEDNNIEENHVGDEQLQEELAERKNILAMKLKRKPTSVPNEEAESIFNRQKPVHDLDVLFKKVKYD